MRITNNILSDGFLINLSKNLNQLNKLNEQTTSGKAVSRPSDNPILVGKIMSLDNNILQNVQYNSNIKDTLGWVHTQDAALKDASDALKRVRDLVIYGANGSLAEEDRLAIREEVVNQIDHLEDILNTNFDGRYIFAGQRTTEKPFKVGDDLIINYEVGDNNDKNISREIATGVTVDLITDGNKLINIEGANNNNLGSLLKDIVDDLETGGTDSINKLANEHLSDMDKHLDNILKVRTHIGAIDNRLQAAEDRNEAENLNLKEVLSEKADVDVVEKYMESVILSTVYQASLSAGAKILQPSLLDFVR